MFRPPARCPLFPYTTLFRSERPVKAAELFAFTLRVRAGNTDVLTDAEENVSVSCAYRSEERFSRNAETDLVCRLLLEKKNNTGRYGNARAFPSGPVPHRARL